MNRPDFMALRITPTGKEFLKVGDFCWGFFVITIPNEDKAALFFADVRIHFEIGRDGCALAISGNKANLAIAIIFKAMEWALRVAIMEFTRA
jgi:hypothetical protein